MIGVTWTLSILISFIAMQLNWHCAEGDSLTVDNLDNCNASLNQTYAISLSRISFYIPVVIMVGFHLWRGQQGPVRKQPPRIDAWRQLAENVYWKRNESFKDSFHRHGRVCFLLAAVFRP